MTLDRKINNLIGKPYDVNNFNCWDLVRELDDRVPSIDIVAQQFTAMKALKSGLASKLLYKEVYNFQDGDLIMLGNKKENLHHAGYYYKGLLVHNRPSSGVVAEQFEVIKAQFIHTRGFRYDG